MFAGCARAWSRFTDNIWNNDGRAFWIILVVFGLRCHEMSKVRPLNNKEKRNKDREALKVDGTKLQARHSSLARELHAMSKHRSATLPSAGKLT